MNFVKNLRKKIDIKDSSIFLYCIETPILNKTHDNKMLIKLHGNLLIATSHEKHLLQSIHSAYRPYAELKTTFVITKKKLSLQSLLSTLILVDLSPPPQASAWRGGVWFHMPSHTSIRKRWTFSTVGRFIWNDPTAPVRCYFG